MSMKYGYLEFRYKNRAAVEHRDGIAADPTINIGDNIQSLAVRSICKRLGIDDSNLVGINRDDIPKYDGEPVKLLMNGCFYPHCFPLPLTITPVFFGFNTNSAKLVRENLALFQMHQPIGCRDCGTRDLLVKLGISAYVTGCLTLILEKRQQPPADGGVVIAYGGGSGAFPGSLLQHIPMPLLDGAKFVYQREPISVRPLGNAELAMADQLASSYLDIYRNKAALVITSLLHVASPCLGMGVPVVLARGDLNQRFSAIDKLIPVHTPENFQSINWSPETIDIEPLKRVMAKVLACLIADQPVDAADIAFLAKTYDAKRLSTGPTVIRHRGKPRGRIYRFFHLHWLRKRTGQPKSASN